ncbi:hypothetical protein DFQ27_006188 [Actinomortierella ambigua]|uniref:Exostosin GT47 domain-containing protein n=1 Tax=Actinomortierella ambigua TaxID=1343610 RepID=A0A9P6U1G0_9FUNG|nr:hypothetical protein DFQ27_006188 [Actinomortierella ambigua]
MWPPPLNQPLCLPKIFVYPDDPRMGPFQMGNATVGTAYIAETILLRQLRDPTSAVHRTYVTTNPEEADFFFIPFRGSAYLTYCWFHEGREKKECEAEADVEYVRRMMDHIENDHPYWKRSQGKDHIMIHPMDMTALYYKDRRRFQNATFLTTIGDRRHVAVERRQTRRYHDITIPSATAILDIAKVSPLDYVGPRGHPRQHIGRDIFVIFAGIYRDVKRTDQYSSGIRALLNEGIDKLPGYMITKGWQYEEYAQLLARSKYGLSPQGWTLDTTRVWEYIAFGVVPVIIADGIIMPFEDDIDWDSFTVRIRRADAHRLDQILRSITPEEYERKRQALWEHGRQVLLTRDAWHLIVRQLCRMRDDLVGMKTIPGGKHVSLSLTNATIQTTRFP